MHAWLHFSPLSYIRVFPWGAKILAIPPSHRSPSPLSNHSLTPSPEICHRNVQFLKSFFTSFSLYFACFFSSKLHQKALFHALITKICCIAAFLASADKSPTPIRLCPWFESPLPPFNSVPKSRSPSRKILWKNLVIKL